MNKNRDDKSNVRPPTALTAVFSATVSVFVYVPGYSAEKAFPAKISGHISDMMHSRSLIMPFFNFPDEFFCADRILRDGFALLFSVKAVLLSYRPSVPSS